MAVNEVTHLAEQSQDPADTIADIISILQPQTTDLLGSIEAANTEVEEGTVEDIPAQLAILHERIAETCEGVTEITPSVESQAHNAESVSDVISAAARLFQEITASIQQISSGIDEQVWPVLFHFNNYRKGERIRAATAIKTGRWRESDTSVRRTALH